MIAVFVGGVVGPGDSVPLIAGMILIFIYIATLLYFLSNPLKAAPLMSDYETEARLSQMPPAIGATAREEPAGDAPEDVSEGDAVPAEHESAEAEVVARYWDQPCQTIADTYKLTPRELDVLKEIARGYTLATMEEHLFISRNTMKMHMRHIYTKLDTHNRQDVIDMVETMGQLRGFPAFPPTTGRMSSIWWRRSDRSSRSERSHASRLISHRAAGPVLVSPRVFFTFLQFKS